MISHLDKRHVDDARPLPPRGRLPSRGGPVPSRPQAHLGTTPRERSRLGSACFGRARLGNPASGRAHLGNAPPERAHLGNTSSGRARLRINSRRRARLRTNILGRARVRIGGRTTSPARWLKSRPGDLITASDFSAIRFRNENYYTRKTSSHVPAQMCSNFRCKLDRTFSKLHF